jgi:hypothetical protein
MTLRSPIETPHSSPPLSAFAAQNKYISLRCENPRKQARNRQTNRGKAAASALSGGPPISLSPLQLRSDTTFLAHSDPIRERFQPPAH